MFTIELRKCGADNTDAPDAWVGQWNEELDGGGEREHFGVTIRGRHIATFTTIKDARRVLNRLPDEVFETFPIVTICPNG